MKDLVWLKNTSQVKREMPDNLYPWLVQANNLVMALKKQYTNYKFERIVLNQVRYFNPTEQQVLGVDQGYLRCVAHKVAGRRVIYARVAMPEPTYTLMQDQLEGLGKKAIGGGLLYGNPAIKRSGLRFCQISREDAGFEDVFVALGHDISHVWARYSLFYWYGQPLMIQEFFVPDVLPVVKIPMRNQIKCFRIKEKCLDYIRLVRLHRPVPILLILWPMYFALWVAAQGFPGWKLLVIFTLGAFLMRSVGDIINDVVDRRLDPAIERTKNRPIATKRLSWQAAVIFAGILSLIALGLVLMLNTLTILLAVVVVGLSIIYPFMKRYTHFPQLVLGMTYNWGVLMAFSAVRDHVPMLAWAIWLLMVIWTVAYDTLYALADRQYDRQVGVKSTAVLFGSHTESAVALLDSVFLVGIAWLTMYLQFPLWFLWFVAPGIPLFIYQLRLVRGCDINACVRAFNNNHWVVLFIALGTIMHYRFGLV